MNDVKTAIELQPFDTPFFRQDISFLEKVFVQFIQTEIEKYQFTNAVIALSGGLDSTVVTYLAVRALGKDRVKLLYMPYGKNVSNQDHIRLIETDLGIEVEFYDIAEIADLLFLERAIQNPLRRGNVLARLRMVNIFDMSAREKALVIGTSNKTELLIGYSTWYGDGAAGIMPIGDIYKTQVRSLGKYMGIPKEILKKPPSAELWPGQTDELEIGIPYEVLDRILYYWVDQRFSKEALLEKGFTEEVVSRVMKMCYRCLYKQKLPVIPKVSARTVGLDYRLMKETGNVEP
ncbi:MAG: NAD+ synthase [Caldisericia bacterium]|nr:NAD+ synthase [Caldisericia bacterium]MDD4614703.1 NAD+ synthase [Caldisericia bacterium]